MGLAGLLPRTHVSRPRLLQRLSEATRCKLTIVCANAGYGKTTLATEFVQRAGLRAEWYPLTRADRDIGRLAEGLRSRLQRLALQPATGTAKRTRLRQAGEQGVAVLSEALIRQAARAGPETTLLVLDDYDNVENQLDVGLLLGSLIDGSPPSLRFLILSRSVPRFPLSRLRVRQELSVIGEEELAFTSDETLLFLRDESGLDLDEEVMALVQERTEGWPAGITMVSHSLRYGRREKVTAVLSDPVASAWLVYDYLAEEVFNRQEAAIQDFLVRTAILAKMSEPACDYLLKADSSRRTLLALEEGGLFTSSVDPSKQSFRYHQLFREFLREKLRQRESADRIRTLHARAAQWHEREREWESCVHHYVKAGDLENAARVVEAVGEEYVLSGFSRTLEYWLELLTEDLIAARPWLLVLRARLSQMSERNAEALRLLERAFRLFHAAGDEEGKIWTMGQIAYVKYRSDELRESIRHFESALEKARGNGALRASLLVARAPVYRYSGMLKLSIETCESAMAELAAVDDENVRIQVQSRAARHLAFALMEAGDLEGARHATEQALVFSSVHKLGEYEETWVLVQQGAVLWARGDFDESSRLLNRALSLSARHSRHQQVVIGLWLGNSLRDGGHYPEAERAYGLGTSLAELEQSFLSILIRGGESVKARALDLHAQHQRSENVVIRSTAEVVLAAALRQSQDAVRALEHVRLGVSLLKAGGYRFRLASALLHQARIEYDLSSPTQGRESLVRALELGAAGNHYQFFWWDPDLVAFLCQMALAQDVVPEYVVELAVRRLDITRAPMLVPLLHHRRAEVRRRALAVLSSWRQKAPKGSGDEILSDSGDLMVRSSVLQAIGGGMIPPQAVQVLRLRHGLSWREIQVLIEYYLRPATTLVAPGVPRRTECAQTLGISENTVRCHISRIRGKLGLPASVCGRDVVAWAQQQLLLPTSRFNLVASGPVDKADGST